MRRARAIPVWIALAAACRPTPPPSTGGGADPGPIAVKATAEPTDTDASTPDADGGVADGGADADAPFVPRDVGPSHATGPASDGHWVAVAVANDGGRTRLWTTVLHPDKVRRTAELFVLAVDLALVRLASVSGASEPAAEAPTAKGQPRVAVVPADRHDVLLAAFNGGWKGEHGHFGLKADGIRFVDPREGACTIAVYEDGAVRIAPWTSVAATEPRMHLFRQTPPCMFADGVRHPGLSAELTTNWGAAANGDAIIRRSAIGVSRARDVLYFAVSQPMTAGAIADGIHHAGAHDVAELDVNWSYPKVVVFQKAASGELEAQSLFPGFAADRRDYVKLRSARDFFYLLAAPR